MKSEPMREEDWTDPLVVADRLLGMKESLTSVIHGMETEFLSVGSGVERLLGQIGVIQSECESLRRRTGEEVCSWIIDLAAEFSERSERVISSCTEQLKSVLAVFRNVEVHMGALLTQLKYLDHPFIPLKFIVVNFRIQSSYHGTDIHEVFCTLCKEVSGLVAEVEAVLRKECREMSEGEVAMKKVIEDCSGAVVEYKSRVDSMIAANDSRLGEFRVLLERTGTVGGEFSHINQEIQSNLGKAVMAQQWHDIARQKVEHVAKVLEIIAERVREMKERPDTDLEEIRYFVRSAAEIQQRHLDSVFSSLQKSADDIASGMDGVSSNGLKAKDAAERMGYLMFSSGVASRCGEGVGEIMETLGMSVKKIAEITLAMHGLTDRFVSCRQKVVSLAVAVRMVALNAQVLCARVPNGQALDVLAEQTRGMADEAIESVKVFSVGLDKVRLELTGIGDVVSVFRARAESDQKALGEVSAGIFRRLSELERSVPEVIAEIRERQRPFSRAVEAIVSQIKFPERIQSVARESDLIFRHLAEWGDTRERLSESRRQAVDESLEELKAIYTMSSERLSHEGGQGAEMATAACDIELF